MFSAAQVGHSRYTRQQFTSTPLGRLEREDHRTELQKDADRMKAAQSQTLSFLEDQNAK